MSLLKRKILQQNLSSTQHPNRTYYTGRSSPNHLPALVVDLLALIYDSALGVACSPLFHLNIINVMCSFLM
ncbi:hypothetical protein VTG60DRAFT_1124 [Thermothelomyces hinnuleus]